LIERAILPLFAAASPEDPSDLLEETKEEIDEEAF